MESDGQLRSNSKTIHKERKFIEQLKYSSNKTEELPTNDLSKNIEVSGELTTKSEKVNKTATNRLENVHSIVCSKISTQTSETLFSCQFCSGTFRYGSHFRTHQGVHKGIEKDKNKKKFILKTKNISGEKLDLSEKLFPCLVL